MDITVEKNMEAGIMQGFIGWIPQILHAPKCLILTVGIMQFAIIVYEGHAGLLVSTYHLSFLQKSRAPPVQPEGYRIKVILMEESLHHLIRYGLEFRVYSGHAGFLFSISSTPFSLGSAVY